MAILSLGKAWNGVLRSWWCCWISTQMKGWSVPMAWPPAICSTTPPQAKATTHLKQAAWLPFCLILWSLISIALFPLRWTPVNADCLHLHLIKQYTAYTAWGSNLIISFSSSRCLLFHTQSPLALRAKHDHRASHFRVSWDLSPRHFYKHFCVWCQNF